MSRTPSPILRKGKQVVSPLRASRASDDFDDMPEYVRSVRKPRVGKLRGRYGINELAQIVGSKAYRDIKRSGNFMPGQFKLWNDSENGGNGKYWGGYQDADGDGLAHEFVVRRGTATGPMIAVNGYTTKQSDWAGRKAFYEAYPKRKDRKGKTVKSYMQEEYYVPTYDGMQIKEWGIQPGSGDDEFAGEEWNRYKKYTPKELTPYQAVNKYIVMPALEAHLAEINMTKKEYLSTYGGVSVLSRLASDIYYELVKAPVLAYLDNMGVTPELEKAFLENKPENYEETSNYAAEFEKYVFGKKNVRDFVKTYVSERVLPNATEAIRHYGALIEGDHLKDPTPIPEPSQLEI